MNNKNLTQADKAREYCKAHGIRLYISPIEVGSSLCLLADFEGEGNLMPVAEVKNDAFEFESGYALFWEVAHGYIQ